MMNWTKLGKIFEAKKQHSWMVSHSALPFAEWQKGDIFRIYFSTRDEKNRSYTAFLDIDINSPDRILYLSEKPLLSPGELGAFDDSGSMGSWIINEANRKYLYYTGWSLGITVPFYFFIGLAVSDDGEHFNKISRGPLIGRDDIDPYLTASPFIIKEKETWRMWYVSCVKWILENDKAKHYYHIKYAESKDGIKWKRDGRVCIDFKSKNEYAISRPCVISDNGIYKMWYSYRGVKYRIGYAESPDGIKWKRMDDRAGIDVSASGWDSEMVEYPFVFDHMGRRYMLYNGNDYGKTGFGMAILEEG